MNYVAKISIVLSLAGSAFAMEKAAKIREQQHISPNFNIDWRREIQQTRSFSEEGGYVGKSTATITLEPEMMTLLHKMANDSATPAEKAAACKQFTSFYNVRYIKLLDLSAQFANNSNPFVDTEYLKYNLQLLLAGTLASVTDSSDCNYKLSKLSQHPLFKSHEIFFGHIVQ